MKILTFIILLTFNYAKAQTSTRNMTETQLTESSCGAIALSQMQMLKEASMKKAIFSKEIDTKIFSAAEELNTQGAKITPQTSDTEIVKPFLKTFDALRKESFAKECTALFSPVTTKCFKLYKAGSREEANNCAKSLDQKKIQVLLDKHFLKKK